MAKSVLSAPHFQDEQAAFAYVEAALWPNGPTCPHCGNVDQAKIGRMNGKTTRMGLCKCYECKKPFTVRQGTIFEGSHLALRYWLQVMCLMTASKKGISTRQIQRMLQCSMKTAWHLTHRIRHAMDEGSLTPMGGAGQHIEVDETYIGQKHGHTPHAGTHHKMAILSLVERGGRARSFVIDKASIRDIAPIVARNVAKESTLQTDEAKLYQSIGREFADHQTVHHKKGVWQAGTAGTNRIEGFFGIFKWGLRGTYHFCSEQHLHRYLAEFDFRYNHREKLGVNDMQRAAKVLKGVVGKRLSYQTARGA